MRSLESVLQSLCAVRMFTCVCRTLYVCVCVCVLLYACVYAYVCATNTVRMYVYNSLCTVYSPMSVHLKQTIPLYPIFATLDYCLIRSMNCSAFLYFVVGDCPPTIIPSPLILLNAHSIRLFHNQLDHSPNCVV